MHHIRRYALLATIVILVAGSACRRRGSTVTGTRVESTPHRAKVYVSARSDRDFAPVVLNSGTVVKTPAAITWSWNKIPSGVGYVLVVWDDGTQSAPKAVYRSRPNVTVRFSKSSANTVKKQPKPPVKTDTPPPPPPIEEAKTDEDN